MKKELDLKAIEQVIFRELQRQGVEFAQVHIREFGNEKQFIVEAFTEKQIRPACLESARIANQLEKSS